MHDFCFTIPYGMLLIGGGFIGYMKKGSITSFAGGAGTGAITHSRWISQSQGFREEEEEFLYRCCSPDSHLSGAHTSHGTALLADSKDYAGWFGCWDQCSDDLFLRIQDRYWWQ